MNTEREVYASTKGLPLSKPLCLHHAQILGGKNNLKTEAHLQICLSGLTLLTLISVTLASVYLQPFQRLDITDYKVVGWQ